MSQKAFSCRIKLFYHIRGNIRICDFSCCMDSRWLWPPSRKRTAEYQQSASWTVYDRCSLRHLCGALTRSTQVDLFSSHGPYRLSAVSTVEGVQTIFEGAESSLGYTKILRICFLRVESPSWEYTTHSDAPSRNPAIHAIRIASKVINGQITLIDSISDILTAPITA